MHQTATRTQPYALGAGEGKIVNQGIDFILKASEIAEGSGSAFLEYVTRQGEEPPSHTHETEDEMFYVLEGALTFHCGDQTFDVEKGGFIFLPRGLEHGYTIRSEEPVRLIVVTAPVREGVRGGRVLPGGWGGFVADMEKR